VAEPLFRKVDCLMLHAADLDAAVRFYGDRLGHAIIWRTDDAVGFRLPDTDAELVVHGKTGPETDILVANADAAYRRLIAAGARTIRAPFDIAIGRCAVVEDPFGNVLTVLDQTKGEFVTGDDGRVTGVRAKPG
jgi:predicted enzyme related to lactoylglutathione lyase